MGMFSYNCKICGLDAMSKLSYKNTPKWLRKIVATLADGSVIKGEYDGYGRVNGCDIRQRPPSGLNHDYLFLWDLLFNASIIHQHCYDLANDEMKSLVNKSSLWAPNQGFGNTAKWIKQPTSRNIKNIAAANAINEVIFLFCLMISSYKRAEEERAIIKRFKELKELMERADALIKEYSNP